MPLPRLLPALLIACAAAGANAGPREDELFARLLHALKPVPEFKRQQNIGAVLRDFKREGVIPFRPVRMDYTDYYPVRPGVQLLGHDLVVLEEEYIVQYVGCCVSEGGGLVLRLRGDTQALADFASKNRCGLQTYESLEKFRSNTNLGFPLPAGRYAELSCRARDEGG